MNGPQNFDTGHGGQSRCIHKYVHTRDGTLICKKCGEEIMVTGQQAGADIEQTDYMYGPKDKVGKFNRFIRRLADSFWFYWPTPRH